MSGYEACGYCKIVNNDAMVRCFACDVYFHAKCTGINGSIADKIRYDTGFHYYCKKHREVSVAALLNKIDTLQNFHRKFAQLMGDYQRVLETDAAALYEDIQASKEPVSKPNPQEISKATTRSAAAKNAKNSEIVHEPRRAPPKRKTTVPEGAHVLDPKKSKNDTQTSSNVITSDEIADQHIHPSFAEVVVHESAEVISLGSSICGASSPYAGTSSNGTKQSAPIVNIASCTKSANVRRLKIAVRPKNKVIFVSNLDSKTTVDDIMAYVKDVMNPASIDLLRVFKISADNRFYSSFKIICPESMFDSLLKIWEPEVKVREFIPILTKLQKELPKN